MPPEDKKVKNAVLGYIVAHGGEINIAKCAEELGLSKAEVGEAIEVLQREGKIEGEKGGPPAKPAPPERPVPATLLEPEGGGKGKLVVIVVVVIVAVIGAYILLGGVIAAYVAGVYVPIPSGMCTAEAEGSIIDKDTATTDNFVNGKVILDIQVKTDDIDDVLDLASPMKIRLVGRGKTWSTGDLDLSDSGKTEADYGTTIEMDGVLNISGMNDRLYVKVSAPTTSGGEVDEDMSIRVEMWPTADATSALDDAISSASHDNEATEDWWDERDTIDIYITAKSDSLSLTGFDGAYLFGTAVDTT